MCSQRRPGHTAWSSGSRRQAFARSSLCAISLASNLNGVAGAPTYLDRILAAHRAAVRADGRSQAELAAGAAAGPAPRGFAARLALASAEGDIAVIAEVKRRSPSKGDLDAGLDPAAVARAYASGGAAALSVLTDTEFFGGSASDLVQARAAVDLPVLRKDFTVSAADVYDARAMGADAVLLIAAALSNDELTSLHQLVRALGMDALVEVHDEAELERAMSVGATLIGVNQRDLVSFEVDTDRAVRVAALVPAGVLAVAESGIDGPASVATLGAAGYRGVLVGETLMRSGDRSAAVAGLREARRLLPLGQPRSTPQAGPRPPPEGGPESAPQGAPQSARQGGPKAAPQGAPQSAPHGEWLSASQGDIRPTSRGEALPASQGRSTSWGEALPASLGEACPGPAAPSSAASVAR